MKPMGDFKKIFWKAASSVTDPKFIVDDENRKVIVDAIGYFTNGESDFDKRKGLCFIGNPGTGKTLLIEIFGRLIRNLPESFKQTTCIEVAHVYQTGGLPSLQQFAGNYFFDDLGYESESTHYGNRREVLHDLVFERYRQWSKQGRPITHFTTNRSPGELSERYGEHFWSRIQQMCNVVKLGVTKESADRRTQSNPKPLNDLSFPKFFITEDEEQAEQDTLRMLEMYETLKSAPFTPSKDGLGTRLKKQLMESIPNAFANDPGSD